MVGLVRPERRNIGFVLYDRGDLVGSPDGVAVVRLNAQINKKYSSEWLFATLRSESTRLQLWTESGGTSYGKLTRQHILDILLPDPEPRVSKGIADSVRKWAVEMKSAIDIWQTIGAEEDRIPIINSPIFEMCIRDRYFESRFLRVYLKSSAQRGPIRGWCCLLYTSRCV